LTALYRIGDAQSRGGEKTKGKLSDRDAKCPYFCAHMQQAIVCESPIPDSRLKINFATTQAKATQYKIFCCGRYRNCELYQPNAEKYEEEE